MNSTELGKKIKEARIAKKMTQNEVVGSFITRNMLSQIESGAACPSVKTLQYLAGALDLPFNYLIPEEADNSAAEQVFYGTEDFFSAKEAYKSGRFSEASAKLKPLCEEESPFFDEAVLLLAMSCLELSRSEEAAGNPEKALSYAEDAERYSGRGIYSGREVKTAALLIMNRISEKVIGN